MSAQKKNIERLFPARFPGQTRLPEGWKNHVIGCHTPSDAPGLRMLDVEHVPPDVARQHNDRSSQRSVISLYRGRVCLHNCPSCFNEEIDVYGKHNRMLTLPETMGIVDEARAIAKKGGDLLEAVKFLGPGELLMNPELFDIIEGYQSRGIFINIFTKGALLGDDRLAARHQGHRGIKGAAELVERLSSYPNVGLIFSFQSFDPILQDSFVTRRKGSRILGLKGHSGRRDRALELLSRSAFFDRDGASRRLSLINAPFTPENVEESFEIYRFSIERGMPMICTPTMISGRGKEQVRRQATSSWHDRVIELYSEIYLYNIMKGIQTLEEIEAEGISPYAGSKPCNQAAVGLYIRASGMVQMCPGRFDHETVFGNASVAPLEGIWERSRNRKRGQDPMMRINNRCPAKDSVEPEQDRMRAFPYGFYDRVMEMLRHRLKG